MTLLLMTAWQRGVWDAFRDPELPPASSLEHVLFLSSSTILSLFVYYIILFFQPPKVYVT